MNLLDDKLLETLDPPTVAADDVTTAVAPAVSPAVSPAIPAPETPAIPAPETPDIAAPTTPEIAPPQMPEAQIGVESLPILLAYDAVNTGTDYVQLNDGHYMISGEHQVFRASMGTGDSHIEGFVHLLNAEYDNGQPYDSSGSLATTPQSTIAIHPTSVMGGTGPDFPAELLRSINATTIVQWVAFGGAMIAGSAILMLLMRGMQSPSERLLAQQQQLQQQLMSEQKSILQKQMGFVEKTQKQNAKVAANSKGSSNFCIGACSDTSARSASVDPTEPGNTFIDVAPVVNPQAAKLVERWRAVQSDPAVLAAWAEAVRPGVKYGNLTSNDVKIALTTN